MNDVIKKSNCLDVNVLGVMTIYVIVFVLCSVLSLLPTFRGYLYPICLLYIIVNNDILQRVLRAVTKNGIVIGFKPMATPVTVSNLNRFFVDLGWDFGTNCSVHICCCFICFFASLFYY